MTMVYKKQRRWYREASARYGKAVRLSNVLDNRVGPEVDCGSKEKKILEKAEAVVRQEAALPALALIIRNLQS